MVYDILIIGGGVIGAMIARELSRYQLSVCLLEKENDVACGASKANSGIVHGGFDPEPGTLKAKLNTLGVPLLYRAAEQLQVPCIQNGSLVCAFGTEEEPELEKLYLRGIANGIRGMKILSGDEARLLEPNLSPAVTKALHIPSAGIVSPYDLTIAAMGNAMDNGVELLRNFQVTSIEKTTVYHVHSSLGQTVQGKGIINCAGGYADKIAAMFGDDHFSIIPRSGEYLLLDKAEGNQVRHTVFQIPSKEGKGILVTPTVHENLLVGPTATAVASPDANQTTPDGLAQVQRLAAKSVPTVNFRQVITSFAGVRASEAKGDFIIEPSKKASNVIHVAAIDSPGLTCCVSIAQYVMELLRQLDFSLIEKENWDPYRENIRAFSQMSDEEKDAYIQKHPAYGKIVCRCELISEGEIRAAIRQNPGALDMDGIKRRTRSGMGRCQGGFCGPYVMGILSQELGIPLEEVTKNGGESRMVLERIGE
ncbi:MAG: NAD(P)/FAD-dependent oxidoreductase [Ruminococcaceae bacterium]|nr:NAD(P)/FAD-dependent oxidoreductase [Oscillospiraceae bacterium]